MKKMTLMRTIILSISVFLLVSCEKVLDYCEFNDTILAIEEKPTWVVATSYRGIYVLSGVYQILGKRGTAGTFLSATGKHCRFRIKSVMDRFPDTALPQVKAASARQESQLAKMLAEIDDRKKSK